MPKKKKNIFLSLFKTQKKKKKHRNSPSPITEFTPVFLPLQCAAQLLPQAAEPASHLPFRTLPHSFKARTLLLAADSKARTLLLAADSKPSSLTRRRRFVPQMASSQVLVSLLVLAMAFGYSSGAWCVCKSGSDPVLQTALDYACGHGADCNPIKTNGVCYNPDSIRAHCSYAVNSYYQKMSRSGATCDFGGAASLTTTDPSSSGCSYPAGASSGSSSTTTPVTNVPSTGTTPVSTTPISGTSPSTTTSSPYSTTPSSSTGVLGGAGSGLAPTGMGMNDESSSVNMIRCGSTAFALSSVLLGLLLRL